MNHHEPSRFEPDGDAIILRAGLRVSLRSDLFTSVGRYFVACGRIRLVLWAPSGKRGADDRALAESADSEWMLRLTCRHLNRFAVRLLHAKGRRDGRGASAPAWPVQAGRSCDPPDAFSLRGELLAGILPGREARASSCLHAVPSLVGLPGQIARRFPSLPLLFTFRLSNRRDHLEGCFGSAPYF